MTITIVSNLRHAARNRESVEIGGGHFRGGELSQAADLIELSSELAELLKKSQRLGLTFYRGNAYISVAYIEEQERLNALIKAALAKLPT